MKYREARNRFYERSSMWVPLQNFSGERRIRQDLGIILAIVLSNLRTCRQKLVSTVLALLYGIVCARWSKVGLRSHCVALFAGRRTGGKTLEGPV